MPDLVVTFDLSHTLLEAVPLTWRRPPPDCRPPALLRGPDTPPRHLGQCTGWDFEGNGVKEYFPQFYGRGEANTQPSTPHNPTGKKSF